MNDSAINGWSPPLVWDMGTGERRIATQEDITRLEAVATAYGKLRNSLMNAQEADYQMRQKIGAIGPDWKPSWA